MTDGQPKEVKSILADLFQTSHFKRRWQVSQIKSRWVDWVGERIAQHIKPWGIKEGKLAVLAEDERWAKTFEEFQGAVLEKINKDLNDLNLKGVIVWIKKDWQDQAMPEQPKTKGDAPFTQETPKRGKSTGRKWEAALKDIKDPDLRKVVKSALIKSRSSPSHTMK